MMYSKLLALLMISSEIWSVAETASSQSFWHPFRDSLSGYEIVGAHVAKSRVQCTAAVSVNSRGVQLVAYNSSTGLCTEYRCRLRLKLCRKCRNMGISTSQLFWAQSDSNACWTTVQHRVSASVDFYVDWKTYKSEFGEGPSENYWIGLQSIRNLTAAKPRKLLVLMRLWNDTESWAQYDSVSVGPESDNYRLSVSGFSGSPGVGDSISRGNGSQFSTRDADNDNNADKSCAQLYFGAWWFESCFLAHPNGQYKELANAIGGAYAQGLIWQRHYGYHYSLKEIEMLIL